MKKTVVYIMFGLTLSLLAGCNNTTLYGKENIEADYKIDKDYYLLSSTQDFLVSKFRKELEAELGQMYISENILSKTYRNEAIDYINLIINGKKGSKEYLKNIKMSYNKDGLNNLVLESESKEEDYIKMIHELCKTVDIFEINLDEDIMIITKAVEDLLSQSDKTNRKYKEVNTENNKYLLEIIRSQKNINMNIHINYMETEPEDIHDIILPELNNLGLIEISNKYLSEVNTDGINKRMYTTLRKYPFSDTSEEISVVVNRIEGLIRDVNMKAIIPQYALYNQDYINSLLSIISALTNNPLLETKDILKEVKMSEKEGLLTYRSGNMAIRVKHDKDFNYYTYSISVTY